jgi:hypothetical protein
MKLHSLAEKNRTRKVELGIAPQGGYPCCRAKPGSGKTRLIKEVLLPASIFLPRLFYCHSHPPLTRVPFSQPAHRNGEGDQGGRMELSHGHQRKQDILANFLSQIFAE